MARPEKVQAVAEIKDRISNADAVFVAEFAGLSVGAQEKLRRGLRATGGEFKVVKMTLARRAVSELGHDGLLDLLVGPTGMAFASGDAAAAAKALRDFSRDHQQLIIKGGLLGSEVLPPERVSQLADLETREVLLAKIAGAFQAPMAKMAGLLAAMPRAMATMIQQLIERGEAAAPAAAEPEVPAAPEAVAETAEATEGVTSAAAESDPAPEAVAEESEVSAQEAPASDEPAADDPSDAETAEPAEEE